MGNLNNMVGYVHIDMLAVTLYLTSVACYHWEKLGKGVWISLYYFLRLHRNTFFKKQNLAHLWQSINFSIRYNY